jgi:hypothetical protein
MKIDELKNLRKKEIEQAEYELNEIWRIFGIFTAITAVVSLVGFSNTNLLGILQLPAIIMVPISVIWFFVLIFKTFLNKK